MTVSRATHIRKRSTRVLVFCDSIVDEAVDVLDLDSGRAVSVGTDVEAGASIGEHRHIQHQGAQLADRLRSAADIGIKWVGGRPASRRMKPDCLRRRIEGFAINSGAATSDRGGCRWLWEGPDRLFSSDNLM